LGTLRVDNAHMRDNPELQASKTAETGFKIRLKVAVGLGAVLVASMVAAPFAAAAVPHTAMAASHSARAGSARTVLVSLTASHGRQGTGAPIVATKALVTFGPHWGIPVRPFVPTKALVTFGPHWGIPVRPFVPTKALFMFGPHWGGPMRSIIAYVPHWG